jgi:ABC-type multidrug transport system fused ATPase/permease subunit
MAAALLAGGLRLWLAWASQSFVLMFGHDLSVEIERRILLQPYSYHITHSSSEVLAALQKVEMLVYAVLLQLMQAATALVISIFIIALLVELEPVIAATALVIGTAYLAVTIVTRRRLGRNSKIVGRAYQQRIQTVQDSAGGIRDIILDSSQELFVDAFREIDLRFTIARVQTTFMASAPRFIIEALGIIIIAALALWVSGREGGIAAALPFLGALALGAQRLLPLVQQLYHGWSLVAGNQTLLSDVLGLLGLPVPERPSADAEPLEFRDHIRFDNVSFTYGSRLEPALVDIHLAIPCGSRIAIIGKTGSGKSTLVDLLMGLLEPTQGEVTVDGVTLTGETRRAWQRSIAHVPQSIFLADTSIGRNIAFGVAEADVDPKRVRAAAATAQLDEFITSLPEGYDTPVGERGVRLSGGQRQRLGIARAIYKQAPVLILDEATSALDDQTEAAVLASLEDLQRQGRTIVIIAHRLSTFERAHTIIRIDNGRVVECGTFAEVYASGRRTGTSPEGRG